MQNCQYAIPLNGLGGTPTSTSEYFQFSSSTCEVATSTDSVYLFAETVQFWFGVFLMFAVAVFLVDFFKNR